MNIVNPIYRKYFPENGQAPVDWAPFSKYEAMRKDFSEYDFAVKENKSWCEKAKTIALVALKIILLPWGLYEAVKALAGRIAMMMVFPAQYVFTEKLCADQRSHVESIFHERSKGFVTREVVLEKEGQRYTGVLIGHQGNIGNGKWALFAPGNCTTIEEQIEENIQPYLREDFNVLMVNGPGVGRSQGLATVDRIGDAQEVGLSFLEAAVRARKIVMAGHSLGGAAIGLAAMKHNFKPNVQYLALRMMTFDRLSSLVEKILGPMASKVLRWLGCEMDSVAASRKFQENGIHEVVIQAENDEVVGPSTLIDALKKKRLMENKSSIVVTSAGHCELPHDNIQKVIRDWGEEPAAAV